jgi:ketosteroid isomerase-like protein
LNGFLALKGTFSLELNEIINLGDIALSIAKWSVKGTSPDGKPVQLGGTSSDILRKQADGRWLFLLDNPWGAAILGVSGQTA